MMHGRAALVLSLLAAVASGTAAGEPLTVAVASNFARPATELGRLFSRSTGHTVAFVPSSTGKLYAQIVNGAPFDVFLAADRERPRRLEESGLGVAGSRFTYALGRLVVWSRDPALAGADCRAALADPAVGRVAIANPALAPYGSAARQFLEREGLWDRLQARLVYGENISQALHFVATQNAAIGLVARSQVLDTRLPAPSCSWIVPAGLHAPIAQDAIVLSRAADNAAAAAFVRFLAGERAAGVLRRFGYEPAP